NSDWHVIVVDYPFNGTPVLVGEYTWDFIVVPSRITNTLDADTNEMVPVAARSSFLPALPETLPLSASGLCRSRSMATGAFTELHPNLPTLSDREVYLADYRFAGCARLDRSVGVGHKYAI